MARTPLGRMLLDDGRIDELQLRAAMAHQQRWGGRIGQAIVHLGFASEQTVLGTLARQLGINYLALGEREIPAAIVRLVPARVIRERRAFPVALLSASSRGPLLVAVSDPGDLAALDEVAFACGMDVRPVLASSADIDRAIARHLDGLADGPGLDLPDDPGPMPLVSTWRN
jgi:type IV pilus assembly protein PilB